MENKISEMLHFDFHHPNPKNPTNPSPKQNQGNQNNQRKSVVQTLIRRIQTSYISSLPFNPYWITPHTWDIFLLTSNPTG